MSFKDGDRVMAKWEDKYRPGIIIESDGQLWIRFDHYKKYHDTEKEGLDGHSFYSREVVLESIYDSELYQLLNKKCEDAV